MQFCNFDMHKWQQRIAYRSQLKSVQNCHTQHAQITQMCEESYAWGSQ